MVLIVGFAEIVMFVELVWTVWFVRIDMRVQPSISVQSGLVDWLIR